MQRASAVRRRKALPERVRLVATERGLPVASPRGREAPVAGAAFRRCEVSELRTATAPAAADPPSAAGGVRDVSCACGTSRCVTLRVWRLPPGVAGPRPSRVVARVGTPCASRPGTAPPRGCTPLLHPSPRRQTPGRGHSACTRACVCSRALESSLLLGILWPAELPGPEVESQLAVGGNRLARRRLHQFTSMCRRRPDSRVRPARGMPAQLRPRPAPACPGSYEHVGHAGPWPIAVCTQSCAPPGPRPRPLPPAPATPRAAECRPRPGRARGAGPPGCGPHGRPATTTMPAARCRGQVVSSGCCPLAYLSASPSTPFVPLKNPKSFACFRS